MITKAQSKRFSPHPSLEKKPQLSALEKGLLRWTVAERGDKVLDAYAVNGLMLQYLQHHLECEVCGVSDDMESVRVSRTQLEGVDIAYTSREDIPWKANTFDSVYLNMAAAPLNEAILKEIIRVLKPGGQLLAGYTTIPAPLRQVMGLLRPEADDELLRPHVRQWMLDTMKKLGLTQITWQRTDLLNSVSIAWKPV